MKKISKYLEKNSKWVMRIIYIAGSLSLIASIIIAAIKGDAVLGYIWALGWLICAAIWTECVNAQNEAIKDMDKQIKWLTNIKIK